MIKWLGVRFSKLLSYSYAGFLVIFLAGVLNPPALGKLREATSWELMALAAIVVGAGIHAFHRTLVVPVHHFLSSLLWRVFEWRRPKRDTLIPTRWLGTLDPPVGFFRRIPAYSALRHDKAFEDMEGRWDLIHAELGLVLLTGEAVGVAALLVKFAPSMTAPLVGIAPEPLLWLAALLLVTPVFAAYPQHVAECLAFRAQSAKVVERLQFMGFIDVPPSANDKGAEMGSRTKWIYASLGAIAGALVGYFVHDGVTWLRYRKEQINPLWSAAEQGRVSDVMTALSWGADPNFQGPGEQPVLALAARNGNLGVVRLLVEKGADIQKPSGGYTPLYLAADECHLDVVKFLVERGASPGRPQRFGGDGCKARPGVPGEITALFKERGW